MRPVGIALVGCGDGAARHHLPILARMRGVEVHALVDCDSARLHAASRHARRALLLADYEEALACPNVDAVVLCLPSASHADAATAALEHGKHVYVEKPLATSLADARRVLAAWRRTGLVGMVGFNYRFNRLYVAARRHIAAGRLGEIVAAQTVFAIADRDLPPWKRARRDGGGALLDLGSHHLDLVQHLFAAPIVEVHAQLQSRCSEHDTAVLQLRLAGGILVQSLFAFGAVDEERFEVYGNDGKLTVDRSRHQDVVVEGPRRRWARLRRIGHAARAITGARYVLEKMRVPGHEPSHHVALARFVAAVRDGRSTSPDLDDGYACVAIVDAAERSARTGRAMPVVRESEEPARAAAESARG